ncbi:MAG TPA: MaoC family dehydratase, partial [Terrimesophilobacter sp.]|uniref:MaoC family dehydratase n=1 Tax=Terrimesophilobacter sp. TaxID=2906435 RepID=UPI002F949266
EPIEISQERIDAFAEVTIDPQWIHVDAGRAAATPFGGTIAHGFLTLSMLSHVMGELLQVDDAQMAINYGLNRVRFPSILRSGSTVRGTVDVVSVTPDDGHTMMVCSVAFLADGRDVPCCVAESVTRSVWPTGSAAASRGNH